jgi:hypothetical protein
MPKESPFMLIKTVMKCICEPHGRPRNEFKNITELKKTLVMQALCHSIIRQDNIKAKQKQVIRPINT